MIGNIVEWAWFSLVFPFVISRKATSVFSPCISNTVMAPSNVTLHLAVGYTYTLNKIYRPNAHLLEHLLLLFLLLLYDGYIQISVWNFDYPKDFMCLHVAPP